MPAARYWRLTALRPLGGGDLELTALHLCNASGRVDAASTLSASHAPAAGALSALLDSDTASACRFSGHDLASGGFRLVWDLGSGNAADVVQLRLGSSDDRAVYLGFCTVEYSNDGIAWSGGVQLGLFRWPGARALAGPAGASLITTTTTFNPADKSASVTLSDGNLRAQGPAGLYSVRSVHGLTSGKWYVEFANANAAAMVGISTNLANLDSYPGSSTASLALYTTQLYYSGGMVAYSPASADGTVGMLIDLDARTLVYRNAIEQSTPYPIPFSGAVYLIVGHSGLNVAMDVTLNAGGSAFVYGAPDGYLPGFGDTEITTDPLPPRTVRSAALVFASAAVPAHAVPAPSCVSVARDVEFGGNGRLYGTTKTKGTPNLPTKARVVLQHQRSKLPVRETWSDPVTGYFEFKGIDTNQQFLALAEDAAGNFRPVAASRLVPEVAP